MTLHELPVIVNNTHSFNDVFDNPLRPPGIAQLSKQVISWTTPDSALLFSLFFFISNNFVVASSTSNFVLIFLLIGNGIKTTSSSKQPRHR